MAYTLKRQGKNVFAEYDGTLHRITDPNVDINTLQEMPAIGGTSGSDWSMSQLQQRDTQDIAWEASKNAPQTYEQQFGSVAAKVAGQAYNPANIPGGAPETADMKKMREAGGFQAYSRAVGAATPPTSPQNAPGGTEITGVVDNATALKQLQQEQKYLAGWGKANPTPEEIAKGAKFNEQGNALTMKNLSDTKNINYQTTPAPTISDIEKIGEVTLTESQKIAQQDYERARDLSKELVGEEAYRAEQQTTQGLPEQIKARQDYTNKLSSLMTEKANIKKNLEAQARASGQPITAAIFGRQLQAEVDRIDSDILSTSAALQATNGNISTANELIDMSVKAKFGAKQKEYDTIIKNLTLLEASPEYKAEAEKMKANIEAQKDLTDTAAKVYEDVQKLVVEALGKNPAIPTTVSKQAGEAKTLVEAQTILEPYLATTIKLDTSVVEVGGRKLLVNNQTGATVKDLGAATNGGSDVGYDYNSVNSQLNASKGSDGFVNTDTYKRLRGKAKDQTSFDRDFSYLLNPNDTSAQAILSAVKTAGALNFNNL